MKIVLGTNIFGNNPRQEKALEVAVKLQQKYPEQINLVNFQLIEGKQELRSGFQVQYLDSYFINNNGNKLPYISEIFDKLSENSCDYFVYFNSDILLSEKLIKLILKGEYNSYCICRTNITTNYTPVMMNVVGFDVFAISADAWRQMPFHFSDYIIGKPEWDVHLATILKMYMPKCYFGNKEMLAYHVEHEGWYGSASDDATSHNQDLFKLRHKPLSERWFKYVHAVLLKRGHPYFTPLIDEQKIEDKHFIS